MMSPTLLFLVVGIVIPILILLAISLWTRDGFDFHTTLTTANYQRVWNEPSFGALLMRSLWVSGVATVVTVLLCYPMACYVAFHVRFPLQGFTLQWFVDLWSRDAVVKALGNSVRVGICVAVASTALGLLTALAISRYRPQGQNAIVAFAMLPLVVPGIIFGVALLIVFSRFGVPLSLITVGLGHMVICLPFAVATLLPRFEGFDRSIWCNWPAMETGGPTRCQAGKGNASPWRAH